MAPWEQSVHLSSCVMKRKELRLCLNNVKPSKLVNLVKLVFSSATIH